MLNKTKPTNPMTTQTPHHGRYVGYFAIGYVLASAVFMLIQSQVAMAPQLSAALSIVVAAYVVIYKYQKQHPGAMSGTMMTRISVHGTAVIWLLNAIYFLALWLWVFDPISRAVLTEMLQSNPLPLIASLLIMMVLSAVIARLSIWGLGKLLLR